MLLSGSLLGWKITKNGEYQIDLPPLSDEEEKIVMGVEENFSLISRSSMDTDSRGIERRLSEEMGRNAEKSGLILDSEQRKYLARYAKIHICGFAFLDELLIDDNIEEISVTGAGKPAYVFIRKGGWKKVNAQFDSEKAIMDVVNRMAKDIGRRITFQYPRLDAMLPDGSRLHASISPVSGGEITLRKFRERPFSPKEIIELGTASSEAMAFLSMLMQTDSSVVVAGNTASGKTTTLNALFCFVPKNERVVITEETPEISIPHEHQVRLVANREMGIGLRDLVYDTLRMRPDRMIVGEVRNKEEVEALFDVLLGGQARGAYATFHAQSASEGALRMKKFGVDGMDLKSIDAIVVQRRMLVPKPKGTGKGIIGAVGLVEARRIVEIAEMGENPKTLFALECGKWVRKNRGAGRGNRGSLGCGLYETLAESLGMSAREFEIELDARAKWLNGADSDFSAFFQSAQKRLYGL